MKEYKDYSKKELQLEFEENTKKYEEFKKSGLKLDMSRGKPSKAQLDMVSDILTVLNDKSQCISEGIDARNYGTLSGLDSVKRFYSEILGCKSSEIFVGGNSSLSLMYMLISEAYTHGLLHSERPWCKEKKIKWLCPSPGYDRHFKITEAFGFELITIPMLSTGPDMNMVDMYVKDPSVRGIWCVPKYSNPEGIIYSDETIQRIAKLKPAAQDFVIMWDNAYCVHEFEGEYIPFKDIIRECRENGNPNMVFEFSSTSKITFPGAGIAVMASSEANLNYISRLLNVQSISYDKINQLRHALYLKNKEETLEIMKKHARILQPKFEMVLNKLDNEIGGLGIAEWQRPKGGYFVSVNTIPGLAKRTLELAKKVGVTMTEAGATFPYGVDPEDRNIRIAPSLPPVFELEIAMDVFCTCIKLAALERLEV